MKTNPSNFSESSDSSRTVPRYQSLNTLTVAIVFIVAGLMFIGRNFNMVSDYWFHLIISWQMICVVIGVNQLIKRSWSGLLLLGVGLFFLLPNILSIDYPALYRWWPVLLIAVGLFLLIKPKRACQSADSFEFDNADLSDKTNASEKNVSSATASQSTNDATAQAFIYSDNLFSSVCQQADSRLFKGARLRNVFGSTVLDLRNTHFEAGQIFVYTDCCFGSIKLCIPSNCDVQMQVISVFGGAEDKRIKAAETDQHHQIVIKGRMAFGTLNIIN